MTTCPTIEGCKPLALRRVVIGRVTYHLCYGVMDVEEDDLALDVISVRDGLINYSRDHKYIMLMYLEALEAYSDSSNGFYTGPDVVQIKGELCVAQDITHTVYSLFKYGVNMQYPVENDLPCGDMQLVSINSTHAIRRAFWLDHAKMCYKDVAPVLSPYQPYSWACTGVGKPVSKSRQSDDPNWLESAFRSFSMWVGREVDAVVDWVVKVIIKIVEYLFAEVVKIIAQVWLDIMELDTSYYIVETMVLLFIVTYRSNLSAGVILIVIIYVTVGLKREYPIRLMALLGNS